MILNWLKRKFDNIQKEEAANFLLSLRGADQGALDVISASQMYWATFYFNRDKDLYQMESWIEREALFPVSVGNNIKQLQKQGSASAAPGLMVWLHSARALLWPELRLVGREIGLSW